MADEHPTAMPRILIVDDHLAVRRMLRKVFECHGFICSEASNGIEAIDKAQSDLPDLIVLDFSMPVMSGLEAARQLKRTVPTTPIVLFTMHSSTQVGELARKAGISAVISKDQATAHVVEVVRSLLLAS